MVTLFDRRAQALAGLGQYTEALQTMQQRHSLRISASSLALEARIALDGGDSGRALSVVKEALSEHGFTLNALVVLSEAHLARKEFEAAQKALRRLNHVVPDSRTYWLGMMAYHQAQGDLVSASGYAARLEHSVETGGALAPYMLRRLRAFYLLSGEVNRARDIEATLAAMYEADLAALELVVSESRDSIARRARPRAQDDARLAGEAASPGAPPSAGATITLTEPERRTIERAAREMFGHTELLPGQAETLAAALRGQDALTILRTGGGKSLCYQLPAFMATEGVTLVVSPLIALMKDQEDALPEALRPQAVNINSTLEGDAMQALQQRLAQGQFRLVYAAPERLRQVTFLHALRCAGVNRLVVDEAHCVSLWGHDFRPDYLYLGRVREALGHPPVLAMTATAPPRVRHDILQRLGMDQAALITGEAIRPNLYLAAYRRSNQDAKLQALVALVERLPGSGIVYVNSRDRAEELAQLLSQRGVAAGYYHAGIGDRAQRMDAQDVFMRNQVRVMVATIAFGMGIDKADIRFIIHYDLPASLEAYYQEAGRAGRDGEPAHCLLLYTTSDRATLTSRMRRDRLGLDQLREVYRSVKQRLGSAALGHVAMGDLARDAQLEETRARVALSLLEEAGLLRRHQDAPRNARLCLRVASPPESALAALARTAHLVPGVPQTLDLLPCAIEAGLDPLTIEAQVLAWADAGYVQYRPAGHDLLLELLPAPPDASSLVQELLDRYDNLQIQRIEEVMAYAQTRRCRHGHISAYLSGVVAKSCRSCNVCQPARAPSIEADLPDESEQLATILRCLAENGSWGRANLVRILRGAVDAPARAQSCSAWGALAYRSEQALGVLIERLLDAGMLRARLLDHGGTALELTQTGQAAVADPAQLSVLARPEPVVAASAEVAAKQDAGPVDEALLAALRAWRTSEAQAADVPAYVVAHNDLLARIAAARPQTLEQLGKIRGIGPKKLAQYGAGILDVIAGQGEAASF
jgi:ATP-dependent DNA helicase RecQ